MDTTNDTPQPPRPPIPPVPANLPPPEEPKIEKAEIIEESLTFSVILNALLKRPLDFIATFNTKQNLPWLPLVTLSVLCLAIFGVVIGAFSGGVQFWAAPMKIVSGLSFGALICLPSLYIFCCLSGIDVKFQSVCGILISSIALLSLLLVGFAPVVWLFSTSSNSIFFFGGLCLALWAICLAFGFKLISRASRYLGVQSTAHLKVWMIVFTLVTLQLPTTLRPIIGEPKNSKLFNFSEKKFFLTHWFENLAESDKSTTRSDTYKDY